MSRRVPRSRVTQDRWLVSYADFITLLFAFFVVLYAFAKADQKKKCRYRRRSTPPSAPWAFSHKLNRTPLPAHGQALQPAYAVTAEDLLAAAQVNDDLNRLRRELSQALSSQVANHTISLEIGPNGLVISLREAGFFDSGSALPKIEALPTLRDIAAKLGATPFDLRIEGHTDNVPIHNAQFDSNWDLSPARATRIARIFLDMNAIPPGRLSVAGYAEYHPVASNATPEGREKSPRRSGCPASHQN